MNAVYILMQNPAQAPHSQMVLFAGCTQIVFWIAVIYIRIRSAHITTLAWSHMSMFEKQS